MDQVEAVVFDAFGTLLKPVPQRGAYHELARMAGSDARFFKKTALTSNRPIEALAEALEVDAARARRLSEMLASETEDCALYPEVPEVLAAIGSLPYAVCSNLAHGYCPAVRRLVPGAHAFVLSCEVGLAKPDPGIYRAAADALGTVPSRILFVGDTPRMDVDGPRAFGMMAAGLKRGTGQNLLSAIAPYVPMMSPVEGPRHPETVSLPSL